MRPVSHHVPLSALGILVGKALKEEALRYLLLRAQVRKSEHEVVEILEVFGVSLFLQQIRSCAPRAHHLRYPISAYPPVRILCFPFTQLRNIRRCNFFSTLHTNIDFFLPIEVLFPIHVLFVPTVRTVEPPMFLIGLLEEMVYS